MSNSVMFLMSCQVKEEINLDVVRKFFKRPAVLKSDPIVTITFFKKFLAAEVAHNETSLWTVTFTPVCSDPHIISVHFKELKNPVQKQFIVTGKPKVRDRVCKGPHQNYGLSGEEGVVVANETQGLPLMIEWGSKQYYVHSSAQTRRRDANKYFFGLHLGAHHSASLLASVSCH